MKNTAIEELEIEILNTYNDGEMSEYLLNQYLIQLQAKHEEELIRLNDLLMVSRSIYKEGSESDQRWEASLANHIKPNTKETMKEITSITIKREDLKDYALQNFWEIIDWYELPFYKKWFKKKPIKKLIEI